MAMKPQKLFYRAIQKIPSGAWHWQIEYENGEPVFFSIQSYTRRFDAHLGFTRIWGRPVTFLEPKPPAASKSPKEFRDRIRKGDTVIGLPSGVKATVTAVTRSGAKPKKKRKSLRKVKRRRSR